VEIKQILQSFIAVVAVAAADRVGHLDLFC
jgi:hypothetical protein